MIETQRLILRRWKESDLEPFAAINQDPLVMATLGPLRTREETAQSIKRIEDHFVDYGYGLYAAELKEPRALIGFIGCQHLSLDLPVRPTLEIGWRLGSQYWGRRLAPEGARAVLNDMFSRPGIDEIVSITAMVNIKSMSVMKRLGMHTDPAENFDHPKVPVDSPLRRHVLYRLKKHEFLLPLASQGHK